MCTPKIVTAIETNRQSSPKTIRGTLNCHGVKLFCKQEHYQKRSVMVPNFTSSLDGEVDR